MLLNFFCRNTVIIYLFFKYNNFRFTICLWSGFYISFIPLKKLWCVDIKNLCEITVYQLRLWSVVCTLLYAAKAVFRPASFRFQEFQALNLGPRSVDGDGSLAASDFGVSASPISKKIRFIGLLFEAHRRIRRLAWFIQGFGNGLQIGDKFFCVRMGINFEFGLIYALVEKWIASGSRNWWRKKRGIVEKYFIM